MKMKGGSIPLRQVEKDLMKGWAETPLVGEWLRVCTSTAGGMGLIPGWWQWAGGTKILHTMVWPKRENN